MRKYLFTLFVVIVAILPQFIFKNYPLIIFCTFIAGIIMSFSKEKSIPTYAIFLVELIIFSIVYLLYQHRIFYVDNIMENFGLHPYLSMVIFCLFNAVNISILYLFGYKLGKLFSSKLSYE